MTKIAAEQLLLTVKRNIRSMRKNVARPRRYPDNLKRDIVSLLGFYSKNELAAKLNISNSIIRRYELEKSCRPAPDPTNDFKFIELPSSIVKADSPKIKMELVVGNVQIKIFE